MSDDDHRLPDMPGHLIRRLQQIALALFLDQAKSFDFTPVQYAALVAIGNQPGLDQTALCNAIAPHPIKSRRLRLGRSAPKLKFARC